MVHQVAAAYQGQSGVMQGYLLGEAMARSGSPRRLPSAAAFDGSKYDGKISTRVYLKQISDRLSRIVPTSSARSIASTSSVAPAPGRAEEDTFVARCPVSSGDDVDELEVVLSARYLLPVLKRAFSKAS